MGMSMGQKHNAPTDSSDMDDLVDVAGAGDEIKKKNEIKNITMIIVERMEYGITSETIDVTACSSRNNTVYRM